MDKDIEELLEKQRLQNMKNQRLRGHQIAPYSGKIEEMMRLNISLPLIKGWLEEKKGVVVTLQTLRNFTIKTFGQDHYIDFVTRNGWLKTKKGQRSSDVPITVAVEEGTNHQRTEDRKAASIAKAEKYTNGSSSSLIENILGKGNTK